MDTYIIVTSEKKKDYKYQQKLKKVNRDIGKRTLETYLQIGSEFKILKTFLLNSQGSSTQSFSVSELQNARTHWSMHWTTI